MSMRMAVRMPAAGNIAKDVARRSSSFVRLLAQLSEGQKQWEVVQYDAVSTMSMRILAAWMMTSKTPQV